MQGGSAAPARFAYEAGEEVVVRLSGVVCHDIRRMSRPSAEMPPWTIGTVMGVLRCGGSPAYALRFRERGRWWVCVADEAAIEGTA